VIWADGPGATSAPEGDVSFSSTGPNGVFWSEQVSVLSETHKSHGPSGVSENSNHATEVEKD